MAKSCIKKVMDLTHLMEVHLEGTPLTGTVVVERVGNTNEERKDHM